jgi:hypothetical protein
MRLSRFLVAAPLMLAAYCLMTQDATAQFGSLTARIPHGANALVVLNVEKILATPLAKTQNWREKHENAAAAGLTILPPTAQQFIMASNMDVEFMEPVWEIAMANLRNEPSLPKIAARWGGQVDRVSNRNCVALPNDSYVVQFGPNLLGAYRPGNRQNVARWLTSTDTSGDRLSPYIAEALSYSEKLGTPIIMALDLEGVVSEEFVKERAPEFESLKGRDIDVQQLAKALAGLRGITFGATIRDKVFGSIKVDFSDDVSFLGDLAKPLLLEVLAHRSAMIDEFEEWTVKIEGNRLQISGPLYRSGMQRILSILDVPASLQPVGESSTGEASPEDLARLSSQQYFKSVADLVDDLRSKPSQGKTKSISQYGTWFNRYADKIDKLPILNVDPLLLDYGLYVSTSFRSAAESIRSSAGRARVRQLQNPNSYVAYGRWGVNGAYGGYVQDVKAQQADRTAIRAEERISSATDARGIMQDVMQQTADIRVKMTQKYNAEF